MFSWVIYLHSSASVCGMLVRGIRASHVLAARSELITKLWFLPNNTAIPFLSFLYCQDAGRSVFKCSLDAASNHHCTAVSLFVYVPCSACILMAFVYNLSEKGRVGFGQVITCGYGLL